MNLTSSEKCAAAESLIEQGRLEDADFLLDQVLESHPHDAGALVGKCALLMKAGKLTEARGLLRTAHEVEPENPVVLTNMANLALLENRGDDALEHLAEACRIRPDCFAAILLTGQIHLQAGNLREAALWLSRASALKPDSADALVAGSALDLARQNITRAAALLETALELEPEHPRALAALSHIRCLAGEFERAGALAKKAHLLAPKDPDIALALARVYLASGALGEAEKLTHRFKARFPDYAPLVLQAAEIAIARGKVQDALADCAKWLRKAPGETARITGFMKVLKLAGAWPQLLDMFARLPEKAATSDRVLSLREEALLALGRSEEAWTSWAERRDLRRGPPEPPFTVEVPQRSPLPDELVLMRFVANWTRDNTMDLVCRTPLKSVWKRTTSGSNVRIADGLVPHGDPKAELLADLAARTVLHAPDRAAFRPYLAPDPDRRTAWRTALPAGKTLRVGVFWQSQAPGLLIEHLKTAFKDLDIVPVSLQFDEARHHLRAWPEALDAGARLKGLEDLVNLVDCLDAVVGPDGIPLHVAGALGRKGIVLLKANHPWHWAGEGETSDWYPTIERVVSPAGPSWSGALTTLRIKLDNFQ